MTTPNLLFLYTDEQSADTLGAYGNEIIQTPNLDRLAETSTVFERTYVTQPVCTPSRSSLLTGMYPHSNGCTKNNVPLDESVACLPELADFSAWRSAQRGLMRRTSAFNATSRRMVTTTLKKSDTVVGRLWCRT